MNRFRVARLSQKQNLGEYKTMQLDSKLIEGSKKGGEE
jgi:hypothetical protein